MEGDRTQGAAFVNQAINTQATSKRRKQMIGKLKSMLKDEKGQALAEYGLILALIAVVCILALTALGTGVRAQLNAIVAAL